VGQSWAPVSCATSSTWPDSADPASRSSTTPTGSPIVPGTYFGLRSHVFLTRVRTRSAENAALTEVDGLPFREPPVFILAETSVPWKFSAALVTHSKDKRQP
jgi:hypothetical protein